MTRDQILAGIGEVARQHLGYEGTLAPGQRLVEDLGLDSIRLVVLAAEVENHFRVALTPEDDARVRTVGELADAIAGKLAGGSAAEPGG